MTNPREIFPNATISDHAALALFAWHALLSSGECSSRTAAVEAYNAADAMLIEMAEREDWKL